MLRYSPVPSGTCDLPEPEYSCSSLDVTVSSSNASRTTCDPRRHLEATDKARGHSDRVLNHTAMPAVWGSMGSATSGVLIATIPAIVGAVFGLFIMLVFTKIVVAKPVGSDHMKGLADKIHKGAKDFLITEYKFLAGFVLFIFVAVALMLINAEDKSDGAANAIFGIWTAIPLLVGASLSAFAGWRGMVIATQANVRTTAACDPATGGSINEGLKVAFKSG